MLRAAVDISFTAHVRGKYVEGSYVETLRLAVNPDLPFSQSMVTYGDAAKHETVGMTAEDNNAWMAAAKPKLDVPKLQYSP